MGFAGWRAGRWRVSCWQGRLARLPWLSGGARKMRRMGGRVNVCVELGRELFMDVGAWLA
ncbi:hypothetical protein ACLOJK_027260, partial [Asimina triloba]